MKSKINFTFVKKLINTKVLIALFLIFLSIFSYRSEFIMFKGLDKLADITQGKLRIKDGRVKIMKAFEELSFPNYMSEYYKVPIIDISLSQKDINSISKPINNVLNYEDVYYKSTYMLPIHGNTYENAAKIDITLENESYKGKIKIHGRSEEHFLESKKSFAIKFSKSKLPENMREIALIILDEQDVTTIFSYFMVQKYLGFKVKAKIVRLRVNGIDQGLYLLEEKERQELLEKNQLSGVDILQPNAMWTTQTPTTHTHQFSHNISQVNFKNYSGQKNGQLLKYKKLYSSKDYETISKLIDIDKFARFEAIRMVHADLHSAKGDNLKLFYNNSTGIFSPFYRSEGIIGDLEKTYVSENTYLYDGIAAGIPIFEVLVQNNNFRNLRNKYLFEIIKDRNELVDYFEVSLDKFINAVDEDTSNLLSQRDYIYQAESKLKLFIKNLDVLKKYLDYGRVYTVLTSINPREYVLEIDADVNSFVKIKELNFFTAQDDNVLVNVRNLEKNTNKRLKTYELEKYFKNERFILGLDDKLQTQDNKKTYHLTFEKEVEINDFQISYTNLVTGQKILKINNYFKYIKKPENFSFSFLDLSWNEFKLSNKNFSILNGSIHFDEGEHNIKGNLIFPYGYDVVIPSGTKIIMSPGSNILIYGGLDVNGENSSPVIIKNQIKNKPFGTILVLGNQKSLVSIRNMDLSGGSEASVNGVYSSGAISLYNHNQVNIFDSYIHHNSADDGVNIKNSNIKLVGNKFSNNFADQVDIDFSEGVLNGNIFYVDPSQEFLDFTIIHSDNGDGVDFSGSKILLKNNKFKGFLDKAVSIGEDTNVLVDNNFFESNRSAVTVKDQSNVFLISNIYEKNKINIEMYQKKLFFDTPNAFLLNEVHNENNIKNDSSSLFHVNPMIGVVNDFDNLQLMFDDLFALDWKLK